MYMQLVLDKVSLTGSLQNGEYLESILGGLGVPINISSRGPYFYTAFAEDIKGGKCIIQWRGNYENLVKRWRIEFNPQFSSYIISCVFERLEKWAVSGPLADKHITITRLDYAIDIMADYNVLRADYKAGVQQVFYTGRDGRIENVYWGSRQSEKMIRFYNKQKEQKVNFPWSRLEVQSRAEVALRDVPALQGVDIFKDISVYMVDAQANIFAQVDGKNMRDYVENMAILQFVERNPWAKGYLGRVRKARIKEVAKQRQELDIRGVYKREIRGCLKDLLCQINKGYIMEWR